MNITVNNITVPLKFGYGFLRRLSEMWGVDSFEGVLAKFATLDGVPENQMGFSHLDMFVDVIVAANQTAMPDAEINRDDVGDFLLHNPNMMGEIITEFMKSLPQVKQADAGKPQAPKKKAQAKVKP